MDEGHRFLRITRVDTRKAVVIVKCLSIKILVSATRQNFRKAFPHPLFLSAFIFPFILKRVVKKVQRRLEMQMLIKLPRCRVFHVTTCFWFLIISNVIGFGRRPWFLAGVHQAGLGISGHKFFFSLIFLLFPGSMNFYFFFLVR